MGRFAAIVVLIAILLSPSARGEELPRDTPIDDTRTRVSLRLAKQFWQRTAPCGRVHVYAAELLEQDALALAEASTCTVFVDWVELYRVPEEDANESTVSGDRGGTAPQIRTEYCTVIAHEYGHLLGLGHALKGRSVMSVRGPLRPTRACKRRFDPHSFEFSTAGDFATR